MTRQLKHVRGETCSLTRIWTTHPWKQKSVCYKLPMTLQDIWSVFFELCIFLLSVVLQAATHTHPSHAPNRGTVLHKQLKYTVGAKNIIIFACKLNHLMFRNTRYNWIYFTSECHYLVRNLVRGAECPLTEYFTLLKSGLSKIYRQSSINVIQT